LGGEVRVQDLAEERRDFAAAEPEGELVLGQDVEGLVDEEDQEDIEKLGACDQASRVLGGFQWDRET
jgi:hypothetical protein